MSDQTSNGAKPSADTVSDRAGTPGEPGASVSGEPGATPYMARTKSFTRRGRVLHASTQRTWDKYSPKYLIDVERDGGYTTIAPTYRLDVEAEFGRSAPLIIEIGTGNGEQIVHYAKNHPDVNMLGIEVWTQGIAKGISRAVDAGVDNLRFVEVDAAQALPIMLPEGCAREVWTFFPDPWRKARHHKRRLLNEGFAKTVANLLEDGGLWRLATDWDNYAWQMRNVVEEAPQFVNVHAGERPDPEDEEPERGGFAPRFEERVLTRFEDRGHAAGRKPHDIVARRIPRGRL